MIETMFYEQLLALENLKVDRVEKSATRLTFHCHLDIDSSTCPHCSKTTSSVNQYETRQVRDLSISSRQVWLLIKTPQFVCSSCDRYFFYQADFVVKGKSYTKRQAKWVFEMCRCQPFTEVAALTDMSHKTVERLYYDEAQRHLEIKKRYEAVRHLGIDEISNRKGKRDYVCVLTDLERGIELDLSLIHI